MHIHNLCARNGDRLNLSIKTGNAHRQRILPQTTINTLKRYDGSQMVVVFTITEINYWKPILQFGAAPYLYLRC